MSTQPAPSQRPSSARTSGRNPLFPILDFGRAMSISLCAVLQSPVTSTGVAAAASGPIPPDKSRTCSRPGCRMVLSAPLGGVTLFTTANRPRSARKWAAIIRPSMSNRDSPGAVSTRSGSGFEHMPTPPHPLVRHIPRSKISGEEIDSKPFWPHERQPEYTQIKQPDRPKRRDDLRDRGACEPPNRG